MHDQTDPGTRQLAQGPLSHERCQRAGGPWSRTYYRRSTISRTRSCCGASHPSGDASAPHLSASSTDAVGPHGTRLYGDSRRRQ